VVVAVVVLVVLTVYADDRWIGGTNIMMK